MTAMPPLLIIFAVAFGFALANSKARLKTSVYILGSMVVMIGFGVVMIGFGFAFAKIWPPGWEAAIGTVTGITCQLTGIAASIVQIWKNKKQPPAKSTGPNDPSILPR